MKTRRLHSVIFSGTVILIHYCTGMCGTCSLSCDVTVFIYSVAVYVRPSYIGWTCNKGSITKVTSSKQTNKDGEVFIWEGVNKPAHYCFIADHPGGAAEAGV